MTFKEGYGLLKGRLLFFSHFMGFKREKPLNYHYGFSLVVVQYSTIIPICKQVMCSLEK